MMLFNSETKKIKYFLDPFQKRLRDTKGRDMATRTSVCLYQQRATWIFTVHPFIKIITKVKSFFQAHISAFMIFHMQKKPHEVSTEGPLTLSIGSYI